MEEMLIMSTNIIFYLLRSMDVIKDLGVVFDSELSCVFHFKEKINSAYSMLGLIKRNFIYLTEDAFVTVYKSLVRSHLKYAQYGIHTDKV